MVENSSWASEVRNFGSVWVDQLPPLFSQEQLAGENLMVAGISILPVDFLNRKLVGADNIRSLIPIRRPFSRKRDITWMGPTTFCPVKRLRRSGEKACPLDRGTDSFAGNLSQGSRSLGRWLCPGGYHRKRRCLCDADPLGIRPGFFFEDDEVVAVLRNLLR